jgi:acylphosphatase
MPVARIYTIKGRVQGVFFRASTRRVAESLGVIARDVERPAPAGFRTA